LQIFTTGSTTTSSSTSTTSSSSWDSVWSFKYLRRWFPTNLTATRCTHHQLRQALLNWRRVLLLRYCLDMTLPHRKQYNFIVI
jgi:hypothetical protein